MGVSDQHHASATLLAEKTWYPLNRSLGGPQGRSGWIEKILPLLGFDPQTVWPVASCYTGCAIPAYFLVYNFVKCFDCNVFHLLC